MSELPGSGQSRASDPPRLYTVFVDLMGAPEWSDAFSVRLLMDGTHHEPEQIRRLCAAHYKVPLAQVGEPKPTTREAYEFEVEEVW